MLQPEAGASQRNARLRSQVHVLDELQSSSPLLLFSRRLLRQASTIFPAFSTSPALRRLLRCPIQAHVVFSTARGSPPTRDVLPRSRGSSVRCRLNCPSSNISPLLPAPVPSSPVRRPSSYTCLFSAVLLLCRARAGCAREAPPPG